MRVIFMGTPDFAVSTLKSLLQSKHDVVLVVTQPDKPRGRGKQVSYSPVKEVALEHDIEVFQPQRIKSEESVEYLRKYNADVMVVVAFGQILSKEILDMPKYGCINVHGSLLPKYRGAAPIQWAVLNGDEISGVTTMKMDEGLDTGNIILKKELVLAKDETAGSLFERMMALGAEACMETLDQLAEGSATFTAQNHNEATKTRLISKEMGKIDFDRSAEEIERLVRGMNPWPSAFTSINGKTLKVWKCAVASIEELEDCEESLRSAENGQIVLVTKQNVYVKTAEGIIRLDEVQLEGKRRMICEEFLRGYQIEAGYTF